jgi:APA family basic amino acid/polyamine antiporter
MAHALYNDLPDYVIFAMLLFYILTIGELFRLRCTRPDMPRPCRAVDYPVLPALFMLVAALIGIPLLLSKPAFSVRGLILASQNRAGAIPSRRERLMKEDATL